MKRARIATNIVTGTLVASSNKFRSCKIYNSNLIQVTRYKKTFASIEKVNEYKQLAI